MVVAILGEQMYIERSSIYCELELPVDAISVGLMFFNINYNSQYSYDYIDNYNYHMIEDHNCNILIF